MPNRIDNLFDQITSEANVHRAYLNTQRGHLRYQMASMRFSQDVTYNLRRLRERLIDGTYRSQGYYHFKVYEPKERLIWAPKYPDKIVQHAINNVLKNVYKPVYIPHSFACIERRGTHAAVEHITADLRAAKRKWGDAAYIVKMDIRKFFYSIDRALMKRLLRKRLACQRTLALLDHLIDSSPEEAGLPLGNLTSQIFANIYLNELDQHAKRRLGVTHWVRYSDDITAVMPSKEAANDLLRDVQRFLHERLHLELHPEKSTIFPLRQGVNTIGFKMHPTHRLLRDDCKRKIKRKLRAMPSLIEQGRMTPKKAEQIVGSWGGHARYGCSRNFIARLVERHSFLHIKSGALRFDERGPCYV